MQKKILALAAAGALGAAMTTGAMAAHMGGGGGGGHAMGMGGGHAMSMGGGHPMSMGGARIGTFAAPQGNFVGARNFVGPRTAFVHPGMTGNRVVGTLGHPATGTWAGHTWAGGHWGRHHHRHFFVGGLGLGLYAYSGYPYDCYNWPYHYGPPYNNCYGYGYGW
jgi:hypothetical protein